MITSMRIAVMVTMAVWVAVEASLMVRDLVRGKGGTARDHGTRNLLVVDRGPYRLVRHPSYTGILLIAAGYGLTLGNWLSSVILLVIPVGTMLRRIAVEEATLTEVIGQPYLVYKERTKRLVPGLWLATPLLVGV